jgi:EAL domain-containing protein (putative c-di-GMP-specific phosphodiesterase class I)/GGDEF domain-containing protein
MDREMKQEFNQQIVSFGKSCDQQTGLLHQLEFQDRLAALLRALSPNQEVALIWIDLVNLRREFSLWGWSGVEALVRGLAATLRSVVSPDALVGRVGDETFVVAMQASRNNQNSRKSIQSLVDALVPSRRIGTENSPEIAAGVAFFPLDAETPDDLARFASLAATRARYLKSKTVVGFEAEMNRLIMRDHLMEVEMRNGLDQGQFSLFYQAKVNLKTGQLLGAEALARWTHPEWGAVPPNEFIPVAERSDLIHRIFDFGLRTALTQVRRWREMGLHLPLIAVNASAANVREEDFAQSVKNILEEIPVGSTQVELEMTESLAFEDEELFAGRMRQLKALGVRIAIDDFGTRYTGFDLLKRLPVDTMKIDKCFIRGIERSPEMQSLCRTIIAMGDQLRMRTVAEGIETVGELDVLRGLSCEAGQGYLFGRPVAAEAFAGFADVPAAMRPELGFLAPQQLIKPEPVYRIA